MNRRLLMFAGIATIILSIMYISWPVGHIPPYDANLVRLAETDLQGYCSGDSFIKSQGMGNANLAAQCRQRLVGTRPNTPNLGVVQSSFCQAVVDNGWQGNLVECINILQTNQYWPTYDGNITNQWNRARPYPQTFSLANIGSKSGGSRTGGHNGNQRTNNPTHNIPSYP